MSQDLTPGVPGSKASDSYAAAHWQWLETVGTVQNLKSMMTNHSDLPGIERIQGHWIVSAITGRVRGKHGPHS